jgi:branched-chain amino acid transport system ATP-binding protein
MEALRVENLAKSFGGVSALQDISFTTRVGEHLAIIGPNGAGKTTLLNVLNAQIPATHGRVYLFGKDITNVAAHRRAHLGIARSFQITNVFFNFSLLNNMLLACLATKPYRRQMFRSINVHKDISGEAKELLNLMDLWEKRHELVRDISYGEQRRLELALTLASRPRLLLLDEPSVGLNQAEWNDIINIIYGLRTEITIILVAHDMDLVFAFAERIIAMHYGNIIAYGTPEEIKADSRVQEIYMGIEGHTESVRDS